MKEKICYNLDDICMYVNHNVQVLEKRINKLDKKINSNGFSTVVSLIALYSIFSRKIESLELKINK